MSLDPLKCTFLADYISATEQFQQRRGGSSIQQRRAARAAPQPICAGRHLANRNEIRVSVSDSYALLFSFPYIYYELSCVYGAWGPCRPAPIVFIVLSCLSQVPINFYKPCTQRELGKRFACWRGSSVFMCSPRSRMSRSIVGGCRYSNDQAVIDGGH